MSRKGSTSSVKASQSKERDTVKDVADVESWVCESCKKEFKDQESKVLECERCEGHYCAHCVRISDVEYEFLTARKDIHWFCEACDKKITQGMRIEKEIELMIMSVEQKLQVFSLSIELKIKNIEEKWEMKMSEYVNKDRVQQAENRMETIAKDLNDKVTQLEYRFHKNYTDMDKKIEQLKAQEDREFREVHTKWQSLENKFDEKQKVNSAVDFKEVIKEQMEEEMTKNAEYTERLVENKLVTSQAQIQEMNRKLEETRSTVLEETDKEARRNNIIIYRIPENEFNSNEERKVMDRRYVFKLLSKMQIGIEEADIKGAFRLGRYTRADDAQSGTNSRPMLVQFNSRLA